MRRYPFAASFLEGLRPFRPRKFEYLSTSSTLSIDCRHCSSSNEAELDLQRETMLIGGAVADCLSKCGSSFVTKSSSSSFYGIGLKLNLSSNLPSAIRPRRAVFGLCVASLIMNSDSFEVGRLIGSYGFMNVTSYSGLQSGMGMDYAVSEDIGNFKVQDIGEGSVKISSFAGFMKEE